MSDDDTTFEPRAELFLTPAFVFRVHKRDAELILRALGGRMTERDHEPARELGDRLTALRERSTHDLHLGATIAVTNMGKAREADGLPADPLAKPGRQP